MENNVEKCCAFLDFLGFSNFVESDNSISFAKYMLESSASAIEDRLIEMEKFTDEILEKLRRKNSLDNIEIILQGSDSIFFVGNSPDEFIEQVSTFVHSVFYYLGYSFANPQDSDNIENRIEHILSFEKGTLKDEAIESKWHPCLLRGGISFGQVATFPSTMLYKCEPSIDFKCTKSINILGKAVISAVKLEKSGPGPKLYIDDKFFDQLNKKNQSLVVTETTNKKNKYFPWTACLYNEENSPHTLFLEFKENIMPALNCLDAHINGEEVRHYLEFVKIHIVGFLKFIEISYPNNYEEIHKSVVDFLIEHNKDLLIKLAIY